MAESIDSTILISKMIDLTTEMAVTNKSLIGVAEEVRLHNKIIYGESIDDGGLVTRTHQNIDMLNAHGEILSRLEKSCEAVVRFVEVQTQVNRSQEISNKNLNRVVYSMAGVIVVILIMSGVIGWREIYAIITALHP